MYFPSIAYTSLFQDPYMQHYLGRTVLLPQELWDISLLVFIPTCTGRASAQLSFLHNTILNYNRPPTSSLIHPSLFFFLSPCFMFLASFYLVYYYQGAYLFHLVTCLCFLFLTRYYHFLNHMYVCIPVSTGTKGIVSPRSLS